MKKIILLFIVLFVSTLAVFSQREKNNELSPAEKRDSIYNSKTRHFILQPLPFFVGGFELGYGKMLDNSKNMVRFFAGYYYSEEAGSYVEEARRMEGYRLEVQYLLTRPFNYGEKYYVGGYFTYKAIKMEIGNTNTSPITTYRPVSGSSSGLGIMVGFKSVIFDNFYFDMYFGGGPTFALNSSNQDDVHIPIVNPYKRSINPRAGLSFGLLF